LTCSLGNIAPRQAEVGKLPVCQGSQLASRLTGTTPLTKTGKNDRNKHDATSIRSQPKRNSTANWQREKRPSEERWPSLGRKPATGRPWRRRGHLQRTRRKTNLEVVGPPMRNEHGANWGRLYLVEICSWAAPRDPKRSMMLVPDCGEIGRRLPGSHDALP
jgi:hypothetical protein